MLHYPCEYCDGHVRPRRVRDYRWIGRRLFIIENVPVRVCNRCGERYYAATVLKRMERLVARPKRLTRSMRVPVARY